ncbi:MAG TPA: heme ABC exporter ATP-binding protein CcmA [Xanthobacteraceae bacterium]|nr:heme ABC exporter ATP-binding protein CcmA [Xanthobacteraceae bacterium]
MRLTGSQLRCVRGGREIFAGLDFTADAGEALAVVGANGAGKTSLLRLIAGLIAPAGGSVTFVGGDDDLSPAEQAHYLGHRDALKSALSVMENLAFWRAALGGEATNIDAALNAVGLDHIAQLPAAFLSAGQRRRLSIARLLAVKRPIWLLDEPTSSLDANGQAMMADLMRSHLSGGGVIVAATHLPLGIPARELRIGATA